MLCNWLQCCKCNIGYCQLEKCSDRNFSTVGKCALHELRSLKKLICQRAGQGCIYELHTIQNSECRKNALESRTRCVPPEIRHVCKHVARADKTSADSCSSHNLDKLFQERGLGGNYNDCSCKSNDHVFIWNFLCYVDTPKRFPF